MCDDNLSDVGALTSVLEMFDCVCLENHTLATNKQKPHRHKQWFPNQ